MKQKKAVIETRVIEGCCQCHNSQMIGDVETVIQCKITGRVQLRIFGHCRIMTGCPLPEVEK